MANEAVLAPARTPRGAGSKRAAECTPHKRQRDKRFSSITNDDLYLNSTVKSPASTYGVFVNTSSVAPYATTVSNNVIH